ncbi:hypothetical protein FNV43_RR03782 [Rhamnella rubrinervis]|uniref:Uncharacterized protein n=1 Tax=Rhamnella rubrinervis TaxID=2594499 RepID=A0A8K0HIL4_9ROSA|nr:hypothetical protein FNV43_RR03782 [Rhamnella rubrinervis]
MATQSCEGSANHSSIALLQERFRQLQKAKEMREEKELLRLYSESGSGRRSYEPSPVIHPHNHWSPPQPQGSGIYHQQPKLQLQSKHADTQATETNFANIFSRGAVGMHRTNYSAVDDIADVDTSLRL